MKAKNKYTKGCPDALSSSCVVWTGPDFPLFEICNGDTITETIAAIAEQVIDLNDELDLSDLDLSCIIDLCGDCESNKNLKKILQLLLDNDCKLKALIDNINSSGSDNTFILNLNLKCLKKFDDFGNEIVQDLNQTLQSIVNQLCTNTDDIVVIKNTLQDLQSQIDAIDVNPTVTEPLVTTCIAGARPTSQALVRVADDYCNYKEVVGDTISIQKSIGLQFAGANQLMSGVQGWNNNPGSLAEAASNMELLIANLLDRVANIETNCCKITCKDIVVGMIVTPNSDGDAITIKFASSQGTFIPTGFTDNGSILTLIDQNDNRLEYPIIVSQDGIQGEFSFVGLDTSAPITASVNVKLQSDTLGCEKCISKQFIPNSGCPVCAVTGTGTTGTVTILYQAL